MGNHLLSLRTKDIETGYNALALCTGFLAAPSIGGAVKFGFKINEVIANLTKADKITLKSFTERMISGVETALVGYAADLSPDAPILYAQMLEQSAPKAADIVGCALNPDAIALHMFNQLREHEHKSMRGLFLLLTAAALKPLLSDPDFVEQIKPAIYAQLISGSQAMQRDFAEILQKHETFDAAIDAVKTAADTEFRILPLPSNYPMPKLPRAVNSLLISFKGPKSAIRFRRPSRLSMTTIQQCNPIWIMPKSHWVKWTFQGHFPFSAKRGKHLKTTLYEKAWKTVQKSQKPRPWCSS